MSKTYVGDAGTVISLDTGQSLASATLLQIEARKPDGTLATWPATLSGTSVAYTSAADTFDQSGQWLLQAHVTLPSGVWRGQTARLQVYAAFG